MNKKTKVLYYNNCWFTNVGEAFIDIGAMKLIKNVFPESETGCFSVMTHRYVDSCTKKWGGVSEKGMLDKFHPENNFFADYIVLAGMFACREFLEGPGRKKIERLLENGAKLIFFGLGEQKYDMEEVTVFKKWLNVVKPALIVTRDQQTYNDYEGAICPCIRGIDCAFWIDEVFNPKGFACKEYDIVAFNRIKEPERFSKIWDREIVRPWHFQNDLRPQNIKENFLLSDTPYDYLTAYANARMVYTDLVHATIVSLIYGVPVEYFYVDRRSEAFLSLDEIKNQNNILSIDTDLIRQKKRLLEKSIKEELHVL